MATLEGIAKVNGCRDPDLMGHAFDWQVDFTQHLLGAIETNSRDKFIIVDPDHRDFVRRSDANRTTRAQHLKATIIVVDHHADRTRESLDPLRDPASFVS
jgi:hypothetical protein